MRLSVSSDQIKAVLQQYFGKKTRVWLFGSRVDDRAKGGDIDLYIEPQIEDPDKIVDAQLKALIDLHRLLGEQKIDLVIHRKQGPMLAIHQVARETGTQL